MFKKEMVIALFLIATLSGCANLDAVGKFADSAQLLSSAADDFYNTELATDRKLAGLSVDLASPAQPGESAWIEVATGNNLISEARRNKAAVASLGQYANTLKQIAIFDNDKAVEDSSQRFSRNLSELANILDSKINPDEVALAKAINSLASIYSGIKVRDVILEKTQSAQPHVEKIIDTLVADIKRQQQRFNVSRLAASAKRETQFNALKHDFNNAGLIESQKLLIETTAGKLVEDELADLLAEQPAQVFLSQLKKTAVSCLAAHKAIQTTGIKEDAKELAAFADDARQLVSSVRKLH